jgi:Flp pilus assembly protein TadG
MARRRDSVPHLLVQDRAGSSAIEFALLAPIMIMLLNGCYDVTQLLITLRQVTSTARQVVQIATQQSVQPDQTNELSVQQAYQAQSAIFAMIPRLRSITDSDQFSVTLSAVVYVATPVGCTPGKTCTYVANTAWSTTLPQGAQIRRPCGIVAQVASTTGSSISSLPTAGMTSVSSVVVADVSYWYRPLFIGFITGPLALRHTAFLPPRAGRPMQYVQYDTANAKTNSSICPGYL